MTGAVAGRDLGDVSVPLDPLVIHMLTAALQCRADEEGSTDDDRDQDRQQRRPEDGQAEEQRDHDHTGQGKA